MPEYKLTYFDIRGLGECIRLMFHYAGVEFEDIRISHKTWETLKPKCWTGHVPFLEFDGKLLFESGAIQRYLAPKLGLESPDPFENAMMETVYDAHKDFMVDIKPYFAAAIGGNSRAKPALYKENYLPHSETYFNWVSKMISESKSGFLVDSGITWGDFFLVEHMSTMQGIDPDFDKRFSVLVEYKKKVHGLPQLQNYLAKRKRSNV